jgi:hypothetical protein
MISLSLQLLLMIEVGYMAFFLKKKGMVIEITLLILFLNTSPWLHELSHQPNQ